VVLCLCILGGRKIYAEKIIHIDAEKYLCTFSDNFWNIKNQEKLTNLVKNKEIKVTGIIHKVHRDYIDGYWITIRQQRNEKISDGWIYIICYFKDNTDLGIKSGDKITIKGYCKGWSGASLNIYRCELIKVSPYLN